MECTGNESLALNYKQDIYLSNIINSINTVAYGLHHMHRSLCANHPDRHGLCPAMVPFNRTLLFEHMMNVSFVDKNSQEVAFDKNGDQLPRCHRKLLICRSLLNNLFSYEVLNYQANVGNVKVGERVAIVCHDGSTLCHGLP